MKLQTSFHHRAAHARAVKFGVLFALAAPLWMLLSKTLSATSPMGSSIAGFAGLVAIFVGAVAMMRSRRARVGVVEVTSEGVTFGETTIARETIHTASFTPAVGMRPPSVRLVGERGRELAWVGVCDVEEGEAILAQLGISPSKSTARFYARLSTKALGYRYLLASIAAAIVVGGVAAFATQNPAAAYLGLAGLLVALAYFLNGSVHVGADGILHEMRGGSRFIPWAEVVRVEPAPNGITVLLGTGERYLISTIARGDLKVEHERVARAALLLRANQALAAFNGGNVPDVMARVGRRGRTTEAWLAGLRDREGTFREAPLRADDLWRIVESPAAGTSARAGAAAVLAQEATSEDRVRLRVAADACAEPRLRVVLDLAASGDDVLPALDDVHDPEAPREQRMTT